MSERGRPSLSPGTATPTLWAAVSALVLGRASCQPVMSSHQAALHLEVAFVDFGMVRICDVPSERAILGGGAYRYQVPLLQQSLQRL